MIVWCGKVQLEVGVKYSKFVKLTKGSKWWYLSESMFWDVMEAIPRLDRAHLEGRALTIQLGGRNSKKSIKAERWRAQRMTTLTEIYVKRGEKKEQTKFFTFAPRDWSALKRKRFMIERFLCNSDIAYLKTNGEWSLLDPDYDEAAAAEDHDDDFEDQESSQHENTEDGKAQTT